MTAHASHRRRCMHLLLTVAFIWAAGLGAYGSPACPSHDALPGPVDEANPAAAASVGGLHLPEADGTSGHDGAAQSHTNHGSDGPCTCIAHCQAPTSGSDLQSAPAASIASSKHITRIPLPDRGSTSLGPRHAPFELPLPNAPPLTG